MRFSPGCTCCGDECECDACPGDVIPCLLSVTPSNDCGDLQTGVPFLLVNAVGGGWGGSVGTPPGTAVSITCVSSTQIRLSVERGAGGGLWRVSSLITIGGSNTCDPVNWVFTGFFVNTAGGGALFTECPDWASMTLTVTE